MVDEKRKQRISEVELRRIPAGYMYGRDAWTYPEQHKDRDMGVPDEYSGREED